MHDAWPDSSRKVPARQALHSELPESPAKEPGEQARHTELAETAAKVVGQRAGKRPSWVFSVDILECPRWGFRRQVIAVVMDPSVVRAILEARGLPAEPPARSPAGPPPQAVFDFPNGA